MRSAIERLSPRGEFFLILVLCFGYFIVGSTWQLVRGTADREFTATRTSVAIITELALLAAAAWVLHVRGWPMQTLGFQFSWRDLLASIPLFFAWIVLYWMVWRLVCSFYPEVQNIAFPSLRVSAPGGLVLLFIITNSVFEECAVAGYVVSALREQGAALAITASTLIRLLYHTYQGPFASLSILPLGLLFAAVYWRWRNIWPLIGTHTIINMISFSYAEH